MYPPGGMIMDQIVFLNAQYGNGVYTASASSLYSTTDYTAYKAFDGDGASFFHGATSSYDGETGSYSGSITTTIGGSTVGGDYLQLDLPEVAVIHTVTIMPRSGDSYYLQRSPRRWSLVGSYDGTSWTTIHNENSSWTAYESRSFDFSDNTIAYQYYRLVVMQVGYLDSGGAG
eukprot:gene21280-26188_t